MLQFAYNVCKMSQYDVKDFNSDAAKAFFTVAGEIDDIGFGITFNSEVFLHYKITGDAVVLFKKVCILIL